MSKEASYSELVVSLDSFLASYSSKLDNIGIMATINSLLKSRFPSLIFVGFYIHRIIEGTSVLEIGPYQGDVLACARIDIGSGVCGTSAQRKETVIVENVAEYENYIACDAETKSEIVVPVLKNGELLGVFDIDSSELGFFNDVDKLWLEKLAGYLV